MEKRRKIQVRALLTLHYQNQLMPRPVYLLFSSKNTLYTASCAKQLPMYPEKVEFFTDERAIRAWRLTRPRVYYTLQIFAELPLLQCSDYMQRNEEERWRANTP